MCFQFYSEIYGLQEQINVTDCSRRARPKLKGSELHASPHIHIWIGHTHIWIYMDKTIWENAICGLA